jgi:hypothetical protein
VIQVINILVASLQPAGPWWLGGSNIICIQAIEKAAKEVRAVRKYARGLPPTCVYLILRHHPVIFRELFIPKQTAISFPISAKPTLVRWNEATDFDSVVDCHNFRSSVNPRGQGIFIAIHRPLESWMD